jgi:pyruvate dehydrogenase E1 component beta subunit
MAEEEGDKVKPGDVLAEIETDKATMEVEAIDEGILAKILVPDDTDNVAVNTPIAVLAGEGEDASTAASRGSAQGGGDAPPAPGPSAPQPAPTPRHAGRGHGRPSCAERASRAEISRPWHSRRSVGDNEPHQP